MYYIFGVQVFLVIKGKGLHMGKGWINWLYKKSNHLYLCSASQFFVQVVSFQSLY